MSEYKSSIINQYGDMDKVRDDVKTLNDILNRQGYRLLLHVIAENAGKSANKFNLDMEHRKRLRESILEELKESINERT